MLQKKEYNAYSILQIDRLYGSYSNMMIEYKVNFISELNDILLWYIVRRVKAFEPSQIQHHGWLSQMRDHLQYQIFE